MSDLFFLDTNILVYAFDKKNAVKCKTAQALIEQAAGQSQGIISWQVAQEFMSLSTKKFLVALTEKESQRVISDLLAPLWRIQPSIEIFQKAAKLVSRYKYSFYDSLIISSALAAGCNIVYSEDMQHKQKIDQLEILNPFLPD